MNKSNQNQVNPQFAFNNNPQLNHSISGQIDMIDKAEAQKGCYQQIQIPSSARLSSIIHQLQINIKSLQYTLKICFMRIQKQLKKDINWPYAHTNQILKIDAKKKLNIMQSKLKLNLNITEQYKNNSFVSNFVTKLGLSTSLWNFEADFTNTNKNLIRATYTQKLEGTIQQSEQKSKDNAFHEFSANMTHICNPYDQLYLETVFGKKPKKNVNLQFNTYFINNEKNTYNSKLVFALTEKIVDFKELSFKFQKKDSFDIWSGYNQIENILWYSTIQRFKDFDLGFHIKKQSKEHKQQRKHSHNDSDCESNCDSEDNHHIINSGSGTTINFMCKFRKIDFIPGLSTQLHLQNFNWLSLFFKYQLSPKGSIEAAFKIPLLRDNFRIEHNSNVLPFFLGLKLSE